MQLQPGFEIRCPHCLQWHRVARRLVERRVNRRPLYFFCSGAVYLAGEEGFECPYPVRPEGGAYLEVVEPSRSSPRHEDTSR